MHTDFQHHELGQVGNTTTLDEVLCCLDDWFTGYTRLDRSSLYLTMLYDIEDVMERCPAVMSVEVIS